MHRSRWILVPAVTLLMGLVGCAGGAPPTPTPLAPTPPAPASSPPAAAGPVTPQLGAHPRPIDVNPDLVTVSTDLENTSRALGAHCHSAGDPACLAAVDAARANFAAARAGLGDMVRTTRMSPELDIGENLSGDATVHSACEPPGVPRACERVAEEIQRSADHLARELKEPVS